MTSRKTAPRCFRCWRWDGASNSLQKQLPHSSKRSLNGAPISYSELALRGIAAAAAIVLEGDVHHHAAGGRLKVHDQRLDVLRAAEAGDGGVVDWRMSCGSASSSMPASEQATFMAAESSTSKMTRPSMSPVISTMDAVARRVYASCSIEMSETLMGQAKVCESTASAALMKGWISSIFMAA